MTDDSVERPLVNSTAAEQRIAEILADIQSSRAAVAALPADDPDSAAALWILGIDLALLFEQTGDLDLIAEAVAAQRAANAAASAADPLLRSEILYNLGIAVGQLASGTQDGNLAVESEASLREALATAPAGDPRGCEIRVQVLSMLSTDRWLTWMSTRDDATLSEAVALGREAVALAPAGSATRAGTQANLAPVLTALANESSDTTVLLEAVAMGREAVRATVGPGRARYLLQLGRALRDLHQLTHRADTLDEAIEALAEAGRLSSALADTRIKALREAAILASGQGERVSEALGLAEEAIQLLPQLTAGTSSRDGREAQLSLVVQSLAGVAVATAVAAGEPVRAMELLERTRGLLIADAVRNRDGDLPRLRATAPALAEKLDGVGAQIRALEAAGTASPAGSGSERRVADRLATRTARNDLLAEIRSIDGFANFLGASAISDLAMYADEGPVIFLTTSPIGCYALIVTANPDQPVRVVQLPDMAEDDIERKLFEFTLAWGMALYPEDDEPHAQVTGHAAMFSMFRWLWTSIAEPVLAALGHSSPPVQEQEWPRVWWCPTGYLALLPIHAAGHHTDISPALCMDPAMLTNPRTVLDRVVSSYTTSLRSFATARQRARAADIVAPTGEPIPALIVAAPDSPGLPPMPSAAAEVEEIASRIPDSLTLHCPDRETVLTALPNFQIAHFACHADSGWSSSGRLVFGQHLAEALTVADISALALDQGLAYLSACDTLHTDPSIVDEAIHLTGAFHAVGYRNVIGTLWPVRDRAARRIASDFYGWLTRDGHITPAVDHSAIALHRAVRRTRERDVTTATSWAAHTHTGA